MRRVKIFIGLAALLLFTGCNDVERCTETDLISRAGVRFRVRGGSGERDTTLSQVSFYSLLNPDSLILELRPSVKKFDFPLPGETGSWNSFVLIAGQKFDTLTLYNKPGTELVSFQCGFTITHDIRETFSGHELIDTIVIYNPYVSRDEEENLWIYILPAVTDTVQQ